MNVVDEALDLYNELQALVRGEMAGADTAVAVNAVLLKVLEGAWLTLKSSGSFEADFILRPGTGARPPEVGYYAPGGLLPEPPAWLRDVLPKLGDSPSR